MVAPDNLKHQASIVLIYPFKGFVQNNVSGIVYKSREETNNLFHSCGIGIQMVMVIREFKIGQPLVLICMEHGCLYGGQ